MMKAPKHRGSRLLLVGPFIFAACIILYWSSQGRVQAGAKKGEPTGVVYPIARSDGETQPISHYITDVTSVFPSAAFAEGAVAAWVTEDFAQSFTVEDFTDVYVYETDYDYGANDWGAPKTYSGTTSFSITAANSNKKNLFYFAGMASNGDAVIERWKLTSKVTMIGMPPVKKFKKTEIYRGSGMELPIYQIAADPGKRFVIALAGNDADRKLYSLAHQAGATPTVLYDTTTLPELINVDGMDRLQHVSLGRIWYLVGYSQQGASPAVIVLVDSQNDGVFDGPPQVGTFHDFIYDGTLLHTNITNGFRTQ